MPRLQISRNSQRQSAPNNHALTVSTAGGTETGKTVVTVTPAKATGNIYKYKTASSVTAPDWNEDLTLWTTWDGTAEITATTGNIIGIAECTSAGKCRGYGSATVTAAE